LDGPETCAMPNLSRKEELAPLTTAHDPSLFVPQFMPRTLAIGDIHGHCAALEALIDFVGPANDDTLITLGDYVNRGSDSRGVIETLLELQNKVHLISLMGNHESMTLQAAENWGAFEAWRDCGGNATLRSYGIQSMENFPEAHLAFMRSCRRYHETGRHIFVHANLDPSLPMEDQFDSDLLWQHLVRAPSHMSGKVMICGHTPQPSGFPTNYGSAVCIDTDVNRAGWLTCLEPATGRFWQARDDGGTRNGFLAPPR
jgi:serine/threonine protein phosphatase 1